MGIRLGLLFCNYGPYHLARVHGLIRSNCFAQDEIVAIELARVQEEYPWQTKIDKLPFTLTSVVNDKSLEQVGLFVLLKKLNAVLNSVNPDVLAICGYSPLAMLYAVAWCRWNHKPAILFSDSTENDFVRSAWKERLKKWLVSQYQSALTAGQPQKRYLMKLGMAEKAISTGFDVIDNKVFHPTLIHKLPKPLSNSFFFSVNRFVEKKNLPCIIDAYAKYREVSGDSAWDLVLCGDGPLRPQLEQKIYELGLKEYVHLPGFLQQKELLPYFAHASCFIHASIREQWGLVVNEAMAAGLPVIVSTGCGCFEDLVIEKVNGFGFDPKSSAQLSQLMLKVSKENFDRDLMRQAALSQIQKFSLERFSQGLRQAVNYALV